MKKKWFIIPRLIIDENKYRGKGRPRKSDYRIYPDKERDFVFLADKVIISDPKNWIMSTGIR